MRKILTFLPLLLLAALHGARAADPQATLRNTLLAAEDVVVGRVTSAEPTTSDESPVTLFRFAVGERLKGKPPASIGILIQRAIIHPGKIQVEVMAGIPPVLSIGEEAVLFIQPVAGREHVYEIVADGNGVFPVTTGRDGVKRADRSFVGPAVSGGVKLDELLKQIRSELDPKAAQKAAPKAPPKPAKPGA